MNIGKLLGGALSIGANFIPGGGMIAKAARTALPFLGSAISGAGQQNKANTQGQSALDIATRRRTETAPLRNRALQMGAAGMQVPREDLSSIFQDAGNPYARVAPRPQAQTPMAGPPPMAPPMARRPSPFGRAFETMRGRLATQGPQLQQQARSAFGGVFGHTPKPAAPRPGFPVGTALQRALGGQPTDERLL